MKPSKKRQRIEVEKERADIDEEFGNYVPSGSDEEYTEGERKLLAKVTKNNDNDGNKSDEDVYGILSSDEMDSDIEKEDESIPNIRAWGKQKNKYYETDYVDPDYGGFIGKEDEEDAEYEEKEARDIQLRLAKTLDDTDFSFDLLVGGEASSAAPEEEASRQMVKSDLTKLSKRQQQALFHKESPEFSSLVEDMKGAMTELEEKLEPFLKLVKSGAIPECPATQLVSTKYHLTLNYVANITFYLLLKARRRPVQEHPVVRRLVQYRQLLQQLAPLWTDVVQPQVDQLLELHQRGQDIQEICQRAQKKLLNLLTTTSGSVPNGEGTAEESEDEDEDSASAEAPAAANTKRAARRRNRKEKEAALQAALQGKILAAAEPSEAGKRAITRQIAKNKGLTPRRKKEQRNPRVKNRNKYTKAVQKRKGQVRTVRTETSRYGGETSGIKPGIKKGIKLTV